MRNLIAILLLVPVVYFGQASSERNRDLNISAVRRIFEAFNEHNWKKTLQYYSEEAVFEDPTFSEPVSDLKIIESHHRGMQQYFPDIKDEILSIVASSDRVVVEFVASGTSVIGEKFKLPICTVFTPMHGKSDSPLHLL